MSRKLQALGSQQFTLLATTTITTANSIAAAPTVMLGLVSANYLAVEAQLVVGGGGTTVDVYVQTSLDLGVTWLDIMNLHFTTSSLVLVSAVSSNIALAAAVTPTDGSIANGTILNGLLGDRFRVKWKSAGTYTATTTLVVSAVAKY